MTSVCTGKLRGRPFSKVAGGLQLLLVTLGACAGGPLPASAPTPLTRRVAATLASHHVSPPESAALLSSRLYDNVRLTLGCRDDPSPALATERGTLLATVEQGDLSFVMRAAQDCGVQPPARQTELELVLNALAHAYDPHSRYLGPEALASFSARTHDASTTSPVVRHGLVEHAGHQLGLLELPSIYLRSTGSASSDLRRACLELRALGAAALVLDLRGNGGGVVKETAKVFGVLAGPGPVAQMRRGGQPTETLRAPDAPATCSGPLVVRVDAGTASVAELLAAALQDSGRALLVGQRTYGKGTGQTLLHMGSPRDADEGAVDVTDRRFYRIDGRPLQRDGVTPDVLLAAPEVTTERTLKGALEPDRLPSGPRGVAASSRVRRAVAGAAWAARDYVELHQAR